MEDYTGKIILETGEEYYGYAFGSGEEKVCEIVFNTSMAGYQEILSDPSYTYQAVVMTYPLIGNYGMAADDYESANPSIGALIVREYNDEPSNFRSENTLDEVMKKYHIPGIQGVDTRKITRSIRDLGSRKVLITNASTTLEEGLEKLKKTDIPKDAVERVSCREIYEYKEPPTLFKIQKSNSADTEGAENSVDAENRNRSLHVICIDCGMKGNIPRSLAEKGVRLTIVPYDTASSKILEMRPDGVFISNGPGDPTDVPGTIQTVKELIGRVPIFGICLGHQILSLAYGAKTYKLKFGHRGGNHPVKNLKTCRIEVTSQNHSYAVEQKSIKNTPLTVTHINLLDQTIEGVECRDDLAFSVQYHPESAPGPQDSRYLFDEFIRNMKVFHHISG